MDTNAPGGQPGMDAVAVADLEKVPTLQAGAHQRFRNLAVSQIICETMEGMKLQMPELTVDLDRIRKAYHKASKE